MKQIGGFLFDKSPEAFCVVRINTKKNPNEIKFVYLNEALAELGGSEREQLINKSFHHAFSMNNSKWIRVFYEAACNEKTTEIYSILGKPEHYLNIACYPIKPGYCGCNIRDYTDVFNLFYGSIFSAHIYVDLERDFYSCLYLEEAMQMRIPSKGRFSELADILIKYMVYPDDYEDVYRGLEREYICEKLRTGEHGPKNSYSIDFRFFQEGMLKRCRMTLLNERRENEEDVCYVHIFLQNITVQKRYQEEDRERDAVRSGYTVQGGKKPENFQKPDRGRSELDILMADDFSGKRILLVEDNEVSREILAEILTTTGADVEALENGKQAVEYVKNSPERYYDIIFMDISMPFMNGYDATKEIRRLEREDGKNIPIIAMTANVYEADIIAVKRAGMNEHIAKPIDFEELAGMLEKWLGQENTV